MLLAARFAAAGQGSNNSAPVPFFPRSTDSNQSLGALNQNFADMTGRNRDKNVPVVGDQDCSLIPNAALIGATEKGGFIFGGTCQTVITGVATASGNNTFSGNNIFSGTNTFTGPVTFVASATFQTSSVIFSSAAQSASFTNTAAASCYGTTVTWTSRGVERPYVGFVGTVNIGATGGNVKYGILVDGQFVNGESQSAGLGDYITSVDAGPKHIDFTTPIPVQTAGPHNVCFAIWTGGVAIVIPDTASVAYLWVRE